MRHMGIDYGRRRIGIAISDPSGIIAFPEKVVVNRGISRVTVEFKRIIEEKEIGIIVVGLPVGLDGKETDQTKEVREFADNLKKEITLPIEFENEMLTTHMVEKAGITREHTDEAVAALILQSYLDKKQK